MASVITNAFKGRLLGDDSQISTAVNMKTDTMKFMLVTSSYTPSIDNDVFVSTPDDFEVSASGTYSAGGATLTQTVSTDDTNDRGVFDATDVSFTSATITARYGIVYKSTGTATTSPIAAVIDFGSNQTSTAGTFTVTFSASGILTLS